MKYNKWDGHDTSDLLLLVWIVVLTFWILSLHAP